MNNHLLTLTREPVSEWIIKRIQIVKKQAGSWSIFCFSVVQFASFYISCETKR